MKTSQAIVTAALAFAGPTSAFWRMPCRSQTGIQRIDPLVDPGQISGHVHTITGGGGFGMNADYDTLQASNCTACEVPQDKSAYWTPTLNFIYTNGTTVMVPQVGGMLIYYLPYLSNITAFPAGFNMIAGDPNIRNFTGPFPDIPLSFWPTNSSDDQFFLQQRALGFNCLNYEKDPEPSLYRHVLPSKDYLDANCTDGLRLELAFPSCGNGSITSSDHKSHMAYPSLVKEGNCPPGYDVHYPFLFFETIWATDAFTGEDGQFALSMGDPVGTGYHGDFIMGWESEEFLQTALDTCTNLSGEISDCPVFGYQEDAVGAQCTFEVPDELKHDNPQGPRQGLPVDVPMQYGPEYATEYPIAGRDGVATSAVMPSAPPSTFEHNTLTYSAANPEETSTAMGGIIVAQYTSGADRVEEGSATRAVATVTTFTTQAAVAVEPTPASYITEGNTVIELFITEVDVTLTATETARVDKRRHLHRHIHHHGR